MSRFLALIMVAAVALFIAGPVMAVPPTGGKSVNNTNKADTTFKTDVAVKKDVNIGVKGVDLPATGSVIVDGDSIFKEMDVNVQDQENVVKFFELDDEANSKWSVSGNGVMSVGEQLQNGLNNTAKLTQDDRFNFKVGMHVGLQYQVGNLNTATLEQVVCSPHMNNFAKQIQIGNSNTAIGTQF